MGSVESRQMRQLHLVKLGVNKGSRFRDPRDMCKRKPQSGNVEEPQESPKAFLESLVIRNFRLMVRETVPSQQQQYVTTSSRIKTTASSPLEKFAGD